MTDIQMLANENEGTSGLATSSVVAVADRLEAAPQDVAVDSSASVSEGIDPVSGFIESILAAEKNDAVREGGLVEINDGQDDSSAEQYFPHIKSCGCLACKGNALEAESQSGQRQVDGTLGDSSELLAPGDLVSERFSDITEDYLGSSEILYYHIFDYEVNVEDYLGSGSTLQAWDHLDDATDFIHDIFLELDPLIGLDFQYTENPGESHLTILSVKDWDYWGDSTLGQVIDLDSSWHVLWKDTNDDSLGGDSSGASDGNDANTIIHEIGHALGLSHPKEDPTNPSWTTDNTVMSYNIGPNGWDYSFSETDLAALQLIWGTENEAPVLTGPKAVLASAGEDSSVTITAASLLKGYSDADGDALSITNLSATNGTLMDNDKGAWMFVPKANFSGTVELSYAVADGNGGSVAASNSFEVTAAPSPAPVNTQKEPLARDPEPSIVGQHLTPEVISKLEAGDVSELSVADISGLQSRQMAAILPMAMRGFSKSQISAIQIDVMSALKSRQLKYLSVPAVKGLTPKHIASLTPKAVKGFSAKQVNRLPMRSFKALDSKQLSKLSKDVITGLQPRQFKTLDGDELSALKRGQIKSIDADAISGLKPGSLNALSKRQARAFTDDQLAGLSKKQIRKADDFVEELSARQLDALPFAVGRSSRLNDSADKAKELDLFPDLDPLA